MRICISGTPGSGHNAISRALADRLSLDYISAGDIIRHTFNGDLVLIDNYKKNLKCDGTLKIDSEIASAMNSFTDFVCDAVTAIREYPNAISIFIESEMVANQAFASRTYLYKKSVAECFGGYDKDKYSIVINRTGLSDDYVVQFIVDLLIAGDKGYFLPPGLCIPSVPK